LGVDAKRSLLALSALLWVCNNQPCRHHYYRHCQVPPLAAGGIGADCANSDASEYADDQQRETRHEGSTACFADDYWQGVRCHACSSR
ncbi:MAG: hypothetical protein KDB14_35235, partial [Planctomycetales bacterium]|nr:hypothetical protein [Planctomycetales bacterium]